LPENGERVDRVFDKRDEMQPLVDEHEIIVCPSCGRVHFINQQTGKLLGQKD
jgi:hypothetical protein